MGETCFDVEVIVATSVRLDIATEVVVGLRGVVNKERNQVHIGRQYCPHLAIGQVVMGLAHVKRGEWWLTCSRIQCDVTSCSSKHGAERVFTSATGKCNARLAGEVGESEGESNLERADKHKIFYSYGQTWASLESSSDNNFAAFFCHTLTHTYTHTVCPVAVH